MSLKNCPFCGGVATMIRHAGLSVSVRCMSDDDKKRGRELAEILLAEADGAKIQWSTLPTANTWSDVLYSVMHKISEYYGSWVRDELFFRVKPEPKKV